MDNFIDYNTGKLVLLKDGKLINPLGVTSISGGLRLGDAITINISATTHNLIIPDIDKVSILNLNVTSMSDLTGITNPSPFVNRLIFLYNIGTAGLSVKKNSASSTVDFRFDIGLDILVQPGEGLIIIYDNFLNRWKVPAKNI